MQQQKKANFHERHEILRRLGKGAFARVYAARRFVRKVGGFPSEGSDSTTASVEDYEEVAVKVRDLRSPVDAKSGMVTQQQQIDLRRWRATEREAHILKLVKGRPHCVDFMDSIVEGSFSYIVMEKCDNSLLQMFEKSESYNEFTLKKVLGEMLVALSTIHALGVVHRDVKPDNFLCSGPDDTVKLCDFGLADVVTPQRPELKDTYGTAPFMSPEMLAGGGYGTQTDMWSFGVIAYAMLLGQFPYRPLDRTSKGMKSAILSGIPEPAFRPKVQSTRNRQFGCCETPVSPGATCFLRRLLCRDPVSRPSADRALGIAWIKMVGTPQERAHTPSLRPMFEAAKHAGAFTVAGSQAGEELCSAECELNTLQARYHKKPPAVPFPQVSDTVVSAQVLTASIGVSPRTGSPERSNPGNVAARCGLIGLRIDTAAPAVVDEMAAPGWSTPPVTPDFLWGTGTWA